MNAGLFYESEVDALMSRETPLQERRNAVMRATERNSETIDEELGWLNVEEATVSERLLTMVNPKSFDAPLNDVLEGDLSVDLIEIVQEILENSSDLEAKYWNNEYAKSTAYPTPEYTDEDYMDVYSDNPAKLYTMLNA